MIWMKIKYRYSIYIVPIFDLLPSLPQPNQAGLTLMFENSHFFLRTELMTNIFIKFEAKFKCLCIGSKLKFKYIRDLKLHCANTNKRIFFIISPLTNAKVVLF